MQIKYCNCTKKLTIFIGRIDERSEKTGRKIRDAEVSKIPYMIIVGEKEQEERNYIGKKTWWRKLRKHES